MTVLTLDPTTARLRLLTGVEGKAARLGHDLVLALDAWSGQATMAGDVPESLRLTVELASLRVESGSGGAKPLSDKDRDSIRANALKTLHAERHPQVVFTSSSVVAAPGGYDVTGALSISGTERPVVLHLAVSEDPGGLAITARVPVRQTDHGVAPYSTMMGALRLQDVVQVTLDAVVPRSVTS